MKRKSGLKTTEAIVSFEMKRINHLKNSALNNFTKEQLIEIGKHLRSEEIKSLLHLQ